MASHESFYVSSAPPIPSSSHPTSPNSATPPPPPPKPLPPSSTGHTNAPLPPAHPFQQQQQPTTTGPPPPLPPHPTSSNPPTQQPLPHPANSQQSQHQSIPPPHPSEFWLPPSLPPHSIPDLQQILSSPPLLLAFSQLHPSYSSSLQPLSSLLSTNLSLAQQVAATESQLRQLRDQTAQLLLNHTSLQTQWRRKQSEMDDALSPWGPRSMYQRLVSSITEQEAFLKAMQESFLEGTSGDDSYYGGAGGKASEKEVTEWVRRIREGTTTLEKRREMRARWDEGRVGGWR